MAAGCCIATLTSRAMTGEMVHVGRGCPAGSITPGSPDDPYLADPAGKIALIEHGACRFDHKVVRAQLAEATGVIVYHNAAGGEHVLQMGGFNPVLLPGSTLLRPFTIPAIFVQHRTGLLLRDGAPPVTGRVARVLSG